MKYILAMIVLLGCGSNIIKITKIKMKTALENEIAQIDEHLNSENRSLTSEDMVNRIKEIKDSKERALERLNLVEALDLEKKEKNLTGYSLSPEESIAYGIMCILEKSKDYDIDVEKLIGGFEANCSYEMYERALKIGMIEYGGGNIVHGWLEACGVEDKQEDMELLNNVLKRSGVSSLLGEDQEEISDELKEGLNGVVDFKNKWGITALHKAVISLKKGAVKHLIFWGASKDKKDIEGMGIEEYLAVRNLCNKDANEDASIKEIKRILGIEVDIDINFKEGLRICRAVGYGALFRKIYECNKAKIEEKDLKEIGIECAFGGYEDIFKDIVARSRDTDGQYYARLAAYIGSNEIFRNIIKRDNLKKIEYIKNAIQGGNIELIEEIIKEMKSSSLNEKEELDRLKEIFFMALYNKGDELLIKMLVKIDNFPVNARNKSLMPALSALIIGDHEEIAILLLQKGADPNAKNYCGQTPLMYAAKSGREKIVDELINKQASLNDTDRDGEKAIIYAVNLGHSKIVERFLNLGANPHCRGYYGNTLIEMAVKGGYLKVIRLLLERGANILDIVEDTIRCAANNGHEEAIKLVLNLREDASTIGGKALIVAAEKGFEGIVAFLLQKGVNVNVADEGNTPIIQASSNGHEGVVRLLLEGNVKSIIVDHRSVKGAVLGGHRRIVKLLLPLTRKRIKERIKDDISIKEKAKKIAAEKNRALEIVLEEEIALKIALEEEKTLEIAAANGDLEIVKLLLTDVPLIRYLYDRALVQAVRYGYYEIVKLLLDAGVNATTSGKKPALVLAAYMGYYEIAELLLDRGAFINDCDDNGTALWHALDREHEDVATLLTSRGALD